MTMMMMGRRRRSWRLWRVIMIRTDDDEMHCDHFEDHCHWNAEVYHPRKSKFQTGWDHCKNLRSHNSFTFSESYWKSLVSRPKNLQHKLPQVKRQLWKVTNTNKSNKTMNIACLTSHLCALSIVLKLTGKGCIFKSFEHFFYPFGRMG